jgi:hypothetical protein
MTNMCINSIVVLRVHLIKLNACTPRNKILDKLLLPNVTEKAFASISLQSITPWYGMILELITKCLVYSERAALWPCPQKPASGLYPKPVQCETCHSRILFPNLSNAQIIFSEPCWTCNYQNTLFLPVFRTEIRTKRIPVYGENHTKPINTNFSVTDS